MKKIVSILSLVAVTTLLHAQGTVIFTSASLGITTNSGVSHFAGGSEVSTAPSGKTSTFAAAPGAYDFALFVQTYTGSLSTTATNPIANGWSLATSGGTPVIATNQNVAGGLFGPGALGGLAIDGLALPSGGTYDTAGHDYFMIVGWSTGLGTTWAQVSAQLAAGFALNTVAGQYFGVSMIGNTYAGGANGLNPQSLFGANNLQTLQTVPTFVMYGVPVVAVPEPTTMALAGLGGLSLLLFRRRK